MNRRHFLAAGLSASGLLAQSRKAYKIDVHHHFVPPKHAERIAQLREMGRTPAWTPEMSLDQMEKNAVEKSMISIVQPGVWFGDNQQARGLARACNEYGAQMAKDHPGRFGLFAALPLPDVDGSLREIAYAFDTLKAEGIGVLTQHDGKYLGDEAFAPVWQELNRRKAIVYVHPTQPVCCTGLVKNVTVGTIEFATDSSRTIASIMFSGTAAKFPDMKWIFSHGGGTMPFLLSRFERLAADRKDPFMPGGPLPQLKKFYYELAQANHPGALDALLRIAPVSNVLYGSDYPFRPVSEVTEGVNQYTFTKAQRQAIERDNALRLLSARAV
jgi:predicted TIM-barrel fold metal-dependent hydrolase